MKKDLNYYLNLPYTITIKKLDDGDYFAQYVEGALEKGENIYEPIDENAKVRINLTIPKGVLNAIDAVTNNRSAWFSELAKKVLAV